MKPESRLLFMLLTLLSGCGWIIYGTEAGNLFFAAVGPPLVFVGVSEGLVYIVCSVAVAHKKRPRRRPLYCQRCGSRLEQEMLARAPAAILQSNGMKERPR